MEPYQYIILTSHLGIGHSDEEELNELARLGWRLHSTTFGGVEWVTVMYRPLYCEDCKRSCNDHWDKCPQENIDAQE